MKKYTRSRWSFKKKEAVDDLLNGYQQLRSRCNEVIEHSLDLPQQSFRFKARHHYSLNRIMHSVPWMHLILRLACDS